MWGWLRRLFAPASAPGGNSAPGPASRIGFDSERIRFHASDGAEDILRWQDLGSVTIIATDTGPFEVDLHWALTSRDGKQTLCVPMGATGEQDLLRELQRRLPDLDNEAVALAMGSTVGAIFKVWRWRPESMATKSA